jgi:hypothetical protein
MLFIILLFLISVICFLLYNNISISKILSLKIKTNEHFLITVKDRQKVGTVDNEDGRQPKSTWKAGNRNYESCYSTETRNGNTTTRKDTYFCNQGIDGGEVIPAEGLYSLDFSNYTIHQGKGLRGIPLTGTHSTNNRKVYTLNKDGVVIDENALTLAQSKSFCDSLKDKCEGFVMVIPTKGTKMSSRTIFISKIEEGWEDPDTYIKMQDFDDTNTNIVSYVKKDVNATEKAIPQDKINATANKYKNLPTCNWKSSNRCIFSDYKYEQPGRCIPTTSNDGKGSYSVDELKTYTDDQLVNWLNLVYKRDLGADKLVSDAVSVNNYVDRCKDVDGYEFLSRVNAPVPYKPTSKPGDVKGRYVRITINNRLLSENWLQLAEVQVISNNRNIAFGKPSSASSTAFGGQTTRANDGNNDGDFNSGSVFHSNNDGGPQYWEVDLGDASKIIDRVIVSNRTDGSSQRLSNWLLSIHDYNKNLIWARIFKEPPNPKVTIDIQNAQNDMNNIRVKDYNQSRFNNYFYRVSDTQYNSKRGWDGKGCYDQCHKEICESEKKKWIGNHDWYGCRDYKPGEWEAEQAEKRRLEEERRNSTITVYEHCNYGGRSLQLGIGTHDYNVINANGFNDVISSIKVPKGLRAVAWEHNPGGGRQWTFESDNSCIVNLGANDTISSIIVSRVPKVSLAKANSAGSSATTKEFICDQNPNDRLVSADIRSGAWMDGIKLNCSSGKNQTFGGNGGGPSGTVNLGNSMQISTSPNNFISNINGVGSSWVGRTTTARCSSGNLKGMEVGGDQFIQKLTPLCG